MRPLDIVTAPKRNSRHWSPGTVTWEEIASWMDDPADVKECGSYVLGRLRPTTVRHPEDKEDCTRLHRSKSGIVSRSSLTLDVDSPKRDFAEGLELVLPYATIVHTTFSSSPDDMRLRLIILTDRDMTPEEYHAASTVMMQRLGWSNFDPGSVQPERYMFLPASQQPEWFQSWVIEGEPAVVDELLKDYDPDLSHLPTPKPHPRKRDPFTLEGVVGAFNRVYPLDLVIKEYDLPYESAGVDRWQLVGSASEAGMGPVAGTEGLFFSHHVTDPAGGQTCSAFDLVRLHRFSDLDADSLDTPVNRRPSHAAMCELASKDPRVIAELVGADFSAEMDDIISDSDWRLKLRLSPRSGKFVDCIGNWDLVRENLKVFQGFYFNEFTMTVETDQDLPWRPLSRGGPVVTNTDRAALCHYLEREFGIRPGRSLVDELVDTQAQRRFVNPVRDYLEQLEWDGVPRVETCLPGVKPTAYSRMVARKSMVAAVARALDPGCKWDHTTVLFGSEGLGKSWWISKMARGYSASLGRIGDKDTLLTMQRSWIVISDEGYSLRKADSDVQKEFLTRTEDVFRIPYERDTVAHPRHCVIWGTTNDDVFLRRQEGNRRFLIVRCEERVNFDLITDEYVDQVWAEAVHMYRQGEQLFLLDDEGVVAAQERESFTEEDALAGVVQEFLDTLVPEDWNEMSPEARRLWLQNRADGMVPAGTEQITQTCSAQVWVEAMGRRFGDHRRTDLLEINAVLKRLPGWRALPGRHRVPNYGPQLVFERDEEDIL